MIKKILIASLCAFLVGCVGKPQVITEYQEVKIPLYIVPSPPIVERPKLEIDSLSPEQQQDLGELAKAYKITIKQLLQYSETLETILNEYTRQSKEPPLVTTSP